MRNILLTIVFGVLVSGVAVASEETAVMAVVRSWWLDSYNKGDPKSGIALCSDETAIVDDFPPHVWQGPGACGRWFKDDAAVAQKDAITDAKVVLAEPRHVNIEGGYAYVVVPVSFSYKMRGKPIRESAIVTMILKKGTAGWQITGWSWGTT